MPTRPRGARRALAFCWSRRAGPWRRISSVQLIAVVFLADLDVAQTAGLPPLGPSVLSLSSESVRLCLFRGDCKNLNRQIRRLAEEIRRGYCSLNP